jgi:nucleobase:cation symporter-1, NCS1 family
MSATVDQFGSVEVKGIELIAENERHGRASDLFWMWMGSNTNIFYPVNGALLIFFGLSFSQAVLAILIGNLIFFGVGLTSLQGPKTGTTTFTISKASFGPNGGRGLSLLNWATCVGFEASGIALMVLAGLALLSEAGLHNPSAAVKVVLLIVAMGIQSLLPVLGHQTIMLVQKYLTYLLVPVFMVMAILVSGKVHISALSHGASWAVFTEGLALVISGGGLSWANTGSDYSRYLAKETKGSSIFWFASLGGMIPAVLLEILGGAIASVVKNASDPIGGLPSAFPSWVVVPYLVVAILSLLAANTTNLYSSGLTLQSIGVKLSRWQCVAVDLVICTIVGGITIFSSNFNHLYSNFLSLLIIWLAPWLGIYGVDWYLRKGKYDATALLAGKSGRYWGTNGFNTAGVSAQVLGMLAAATWIDSPAFVGPLSSRTNYADFSVFMGLIVGGLAYYLFTSRLVKQEAK